MASRYVVIFEDNPIESEAIRRGVSNFLETMGFENRIIVTNTIEQAWAEIVRLLSNTDPLQPRLLKVILDLKKIIYESGTKEINEFSDKLFPTILSAGYPIDLEDKFLICTNYPDYLGRSYKVIPSAKWLPISGYYRLMANARNYRIPVLEKSDQLDKEIEEALYKLHETPFSTMTDLRTGAV